jgi:hypothetical protein
VRHLGLAAILACASPPPAHTIAPTPSSTSVAEAHWPHASTSAPVDRTNVVRELRLLRVIVEVWRATHADECPTLQRLEDDDELAAANMKDEWGNAYKIICDEDETYVVSYGPDHREGTPDDIVYPPRGDTR